MPVALDKINGPSENGSAKSALDPSRIEPMVFVRYSVPPSDPDNRAEYDAWLERVNFLCDDLHWLLQLPHDKFWCQVVFDEGLHKALDSFLRYCPRCHENLEHLPEAGLQRQLELCRLVFLTYLRMSTHKESKDHFITPEVFGEILYKWFLFDIPKIMDICSLFGKTNGPLLSKMLGNIFTQQPKYTDDLRETMPTILQVLSNIAARCGVLLETPGTAPQKLAHLEGAMTLTSSDFQDVLLYLSDTALTLHRFLDMYPAAASVFHQHNFCSVLANFYECVMPELAAQIKQQDFRDPSTRKKLARKLQQTRKSLVSVFHTIVQHVCLTSVLENVNNEEVVTSCIEDFLHTMSTVLSDRRFLAAYESMYSFRDNVDLLLQASSVIEASQFEYIQAAIDLAFATYGHRKSPRGDTNTGGRTSPDGAPDSSLGAGGGTGTQTSGGLPDDFQTEDFYDDGGASCARPSDVELDSLISSVRDILPHLGEGFIELALEELGYNQEKVVSCILEDKLPPSLVGVSIDLPRQERASHPGDGQLDEAEDLLASRKNVFDNDEFDLFRNKTVDLSKVHIGKKNQWVDLDDKSTIQAVRATYEAYGSRDQESIYDNKQMYDDEYDDTYDSNAVGADDADSADELTNNKFLPRVLMDLERKKARNEGRTNDEAPDDNNIAEDEEGEKASKDAFVADPAKLREQAEQRRQSQAARGRRGRGGGGGGQQQSRDVKGAPKGQGQSSEVQHNRRVKQMHKGQRHRANADKKMSKGMF
ncbi:activating signal cointegrator 1 complex subunit 2 [Plakobranchus ocellatus]|uniref:Activating signal cointegrator 1 complex subunit 2 n=1 Tax=Plakobranchus ocellatus TaxID=259542 RepID=A0AAV3ZGY6_9GAST|nr:activating signal cointegrator 1 complex subunit 2 [Plakobranchus ocellatus]